MKTIKVIAGTIAFTGIMAAAGFGVHTSNVWQAEELVKRAEATGTDYETHRLMLEDGYRFEHWIEYQIERDYNLD